MSGNRVAEPSAALQVAGVMTIESTLGPSIFPIEKVSIVSQSGTAGNPMVTM